jgi:hypothetical protein
MAKELPYLPTYKNVGLLFQKIASAKIPEAFVQKYLYETLGLKASGDRPLIPLLKAMGFIDQTGKPTPEYSKLKNNSLAGEAIASGVKKAYAPLFAANENAHTLSLPELKGLVAQVAGTDTDTTGKIAGTLNSLFKVADFSKLNGSSRPLNGNDEEEDDDDDDVEEDEFKQKINGNKGKYRKQMNPEFHYNIQIHLPTNATEETYLNIFNALRKSFQ